MSSWKTRFVPALRGRCTHTNKKMTAVPPRLVMLETPYAGDEQREKLVYARKCMADSVSRGEAPFATHLLYTQEIEGGWALEPPLPEAVQFLEARKTEKDGESERVIGPPSPLTSHVLDACKTDVTHWVTRECGLDFAKAWRSVSAATVLYVDLGESPGMLRAEAEALAFGHPVERRRLL